MLFDAAGKHAPTITAYHGTSTSRLRSILKHGLVPNKPGRWSSDTSHGAQRSRKSFQGVYFSPNLMTAYTSATDLILHEKNGGNRLIVVAQIQPMSSLPDEDSIKFNIPYIHYDLAKIFAAFKLNKWCRRCARRATAGRPGRGRARVGIDTGGRCHAAETGRRTDAFRGRCDAGADRGASG
jgi:hypothetical protein